MTTGTFKIATDSCGHQVHLTFSFEFAKKHAAFNFHHFGNKSIRSKIVLADISDLPAITYKIVSNVCPDQPHFTSGLETITHENIVLDLDAIGTHSVFASIDKKSLITIQRAIDFRAYEGDFSICPEAIVKKYIAFNFHSTGVQGFLALVVKATFLAFKISPNSCAV